MFMRFLGSILSLVLTASCAPGPVDAARAPITEDILRVGLPGEPRTLDPHAADALGAQVAMLIFEGLVRDPLDGSAIAPGLAYAWEVSEDGLEYVFWLREGLSFHDGAPVDAEAVKLSLDRARLRDVEAVAVVDASTIHIVLERPNVALLHALAGPAGAIVSPAAIGDVARNPIGAGPFRFVAWEGSAIELAANDDYYDEPPPADSLVLVSIRDAEARLAAIESDEIDLTWAPPFEALPRLRQEGALARFEQHDARVRYLALSASAGPLSDVRVRQAISLAIDRERIAHDVFGDAGSAAATFLLQAIASAEETPLPCDLPTARALLDEAGYGDGLRVEHWAPNEPVSLAIAEALSASLREAGVELEIRTYEPGELEAIVLNGAHGEAAMFELSAMAESLDPDIFLYPRLASELAPPLGLNVGRYQNLEVDALLDAARRETDEHARAAGYAAVMELVLADVPVVPLTRETWVTLAHPLIGGIHANLFGDLRAAVNLANIGEIDDFTMEERDGCHCTGDVFRIFVCPWGSVESVDVDWQGQRVTVRPPGSATAQDTGRADQIGVNTGPQIVVGWDTQYRDWPTAVSCDQHNTCETSCRQALNPASNGDRVSATAPDGACTPDPRTRFVLAAWRCGSAP
jgi:peptide/nickel transport system substrate-binding protein